MTRGDRTVPDNLERLLLVPGIHSATGSLNGRARNGDDVGSSPDRESGARSSQANRRRIHAVRGKRRRRRIHPPVPPVEVAIPLTACVMRSADGARCAGGGDHRRRRGWVGDGDPAQARRPATPSPLFEKSDGVGGTWRDNTYPGAAATCRRTSTASRSRRRPTGPGSSQNRPRSSTTSNRWCHGSNSGPHLRLEHRDHRGRPSRRRPVDGRSRPWPVITHEADVVVSGLGQLNRPYIPDIPGLTSSTERPSIRPAGTTITTCGANGSAVIGIGAERDPVRSPHRSSGSSTHALPAQRELRRPRARSSVPPDREAGASRTCRSCSAPTGSGSTGATRPVSRCSARTAAWAPTSSGCSRKQLQPVIESSDLTDRGARPRLPARLRRILTASDWYPTLCNRTSRSSPRRSTRSAPLDRDHRRRRAPGRHDRLRHRVRHDRVPGPDDGDRSRTELDLNEVWAGAARAYLGLSVPAVPELLHAVRTEHQPRAQLDPVHDRAAGRVHAVDAGTDGAADLKSIDVTDVAWIATTRDPTTRRRHRVGRGVSLLVQELRGSDHEQLGQLHRRLPQADSKIDLHDWDLEPV